MWSALGTWTAVVGFVVIGSAIVVWRQWRRRPVLAATAVLLVGLGWMYVLVVPLAVPGNGEGVLCANTTLNAANEPDPVGPESSAGSQQDASSCREAGRWRLGGGALALSVLVAGLAWRRGGDEHEDLPDRAASML